MIDPDYHTEMVNGHTFRLRNLPGGEFLMGSEDQEGVFLKESPIHPVRLSPFYISEFLVTQALWKAVMGAENNPSRFRGDHRPVERVTWNEIVLGNQDGKSTPAFLHQLNQFTNATRPEGYQYRLPTEAEWEYAARAGTSYQYAGSDKLKEVGWYSLNSHEGTKNVGLKRPNDFGLYDMSGNVYEWCHDRVSEAYYQECLQMGVVENPRGPKQGRSRVLRGGRWGLSASNCRVSYRVDYHPSRRWRAYGFRLVLSSQTLEDTSGQAGTE